MRARHARRRAGILGPALDGRAVQAREAWAGIGFLVGSPDVAAVVLVVGRMAHEPVIVAFRIAEALEDLNAKTR